MKKHLSLFVLLPLCVALAMHADAIAASNCPDAISAYWKLNETTSGTYEESIGDLDGTCVGCPSPLAAGVVDGGQFFAGSSISIPAASAFNWLASDSFSIELWVRRNTGTISGTLEVFAGRADTTTGLNWYIGINSSGRLQALLNDVDGNGPAALTGVKDLRSSAADPTWHHVALVRDATTSEIRLFEDGEQVDTISYNFANGFSSDAAPLTLGSLNNGNYFSGGLDEVAIHGRALTENEIKIDYYLAMGYCSRYDAQIKIMPLGDSITKGNWNATNPAENEMISYRLDLWDLLNSNLYWADFIGSEQHGTGVDPTFDDDHAGIPGINDGEMLTLLQTGESVVPGNVRQITDGPYLDYYPPQVILLHVGTNDINTVPDVVEAILEEIDAFSKHVTVLMARIVDQAPNLAVVTTFNNLVQGMVEARIAQGDKIIMIDMQNGANINYVIDNTEPFTGGDMYNYLHPNTTGYGKMADKWFDTLETILPQSETPVITTTPPASVLVGTEFTYAPAATGPPIPTITVPTRPSGMTFTSGVLRWTPTTPGNYTVKVVATNWAGDVMQSFTLNVNSLPQATGDTYGGIAEGGVLTISASEGLLINDTDANGDPLTAVLDSDVAHGTLALNANGGFTYTHDGSENFSDSFSYRASDGKSQSAAVTVTLTMTPVNDPPTITGQGALSTKQETPILITLNNLIVEDPDSSSSAISMLPIQAGDNYTITDNFTVVPNAGFTGALSVPVQVTDGQDTGNPYDVLITVTSNANNIDGGGGGGGCFIHSLF